MWKITVKYSVGGMKNKKNKQILENKLQYFHICLTGFLLYNITVNFIIEIKCNISCYI